MKKPRVGVACFFHESNTFVQSRTTSRDFAASWWEGQEVLERMSSTQTVVGGFLDASLERFDVVPLLYVWATPSGIIAAEALEAVGRALEKAVARAGSLDGVLVELHGAAVIEPGVAADGVIADRLRAVIGRAPLVAVVDPHANLTDAVVRAADAVFAYQTNPHVDMADRGAQAARLLAALMQGSARPTCALARVPVIAPAIAQGTDDAPLSDLVGLAAGIESEPGIAAASVLFGFAYADVAELGMAALVVGDEPSCVTERARRLAEACWARRDEFSRELHSPAEAIEIASCRAGLTMLADTGDNVGGGAPGNTTYLLEAALRRPGLRSVATIADSEAVARAVEAGALSTVRLVLGNPGLSVTAVVRGIFEGRYVNRGPLSAGVEFDMGPAAVVEVGTNTIVLQSKPVMANDQNLVRSVGIRPEEFDAVILKGAAAIRAGWREVASRFVDVASPGATSSNLSLLNYERASRPLWPLDRGFEWTAGPVPAHGSST